MTQEDFADMKDVDVSPEHLSLYLHGKRDSGPLDQKVDAFIALHLGDRAVA